MNTDDEREAGHRMVPHTADVIIEAWAPAKIASLEEAVRALVDTFAAVDGISPTERVAIRLGHAGDEALLVSLLTEVVYVVEARGVPVGVALEETEEGDLVGLLDVAPPDSVGIHGSPPKGVSFSDLSFEVVDGIWRCRATIDV